MSQVTDAFAAGVLKYMPQILALTDPLLISYARVGSHRCSTAYNNLGQGDRVAS